MFLRAIQSGVLAVLSTLGSVVLIAAACWGRMRWWISLQRSSGIGAPAGSLEPLLLVAVLLFVLFFLYFWRRSVR